MIPWAFSLLVGLFLDVRPAPGDKQTPETLCRCGADDGAAKGGARSFEEFQHKYGDRFPGDAAQWAWQVYRSVNHCDAVMVIGRNTDTGSLQGKPGLCVLRTLEPWTPALNDIYIQAGLDRQARFRLASPPPAEAMAGTEVATDRDAGWKVVYNRELAQVRDTERYDLDGDAHDARPDRPVFLTAKCADLAGSWSGKLTVRDAGGTKIPVGQSRNATVTVTQKGCQLALIYNNNQIDGGFAEPQTARLDQHPSGALVHAELAAQGRQLAVTFEQRAPGGGTVVSAGTLTPP